MHSLFNVFTNASQFSRRNTIIAIYKIPTILLVLKGFKRGIFWQMSTFAILWRIKLIWLNFYRKNIRYRAYKCLFFFLSLHSIVIVLSVTTVEHLSCGCCRKWIPNVFSETVFLARESKHSSPLVSWATLFQINLSKLICCFDVLTHNAITHGRPPVHVHSAGARSCWLIFLMGISVSGLNPALPFPPFTPVALWLMGITASL